MNTISRKINEYLDEPIKTFKLCVGLFTLVGVVIILLYCISIGYYPKGLAIGDSLFFLTSAFTFTFIYLFSVFLFFCAGYTASPIIRPFVNLINWYRKKYRPEKTLVDLHYPNLTGEGFPYIIMGLLVFTIGFGYLANDYMASLRIFVSIFTMSILYGLWQYSESKKQEIEPSRLNKQRVFLVSCAIAVPILFSGQVANILNFAMVKAGIRSEKVIVEFSSNYSKFIFQTLGIESKDRFSTDEAKVLFQGIGKYVVIEVRGIKFIVPDTEAKIAFKN